MNPGTEWLDVVDDRNRVIGAATRREIHARRLRHRAVHVLLFDPAGRLYVQQRSATKDSFPLCFDSSASGHVDRGEEYDACAARELREELGLAVAPARLAPVFGILAGPDTGEEFTLVYRLAGAFVPRPNPDEIVAGAFDELGAIAADLARDPGRYARSFRVVFAAWGQRVEPRA
jgi:isopentenyl-diphosphate Delta-isomerase